LIGNNSDNFAGNVVLQENNAFHFKIL